MFVKRIIYAIKSSSHVLPWLSLYDLAMILTNVLCIMICHDLDKGTMVNRDLARSTMIMARIPWIRTLGTHNERKQVEKNHCISSYKMSKNNNI